MGWVASSVKRLATGSTVRGLNRGGSEIFRTGPPNLLYNGYRVFPGGKNWPGREAYSSPPSNAVVKNGQSYTSTPPTGRTACTEPQCLYKGAICLLPHLKRRPINIYDNISEFFLEIKIFQTKLYKKPIHPFYVQYFFPENRAAYEIMTKITVEPDESQMTLYYSSCLLYSR